VIQYILRGRPARLTVLAAAAVLGLAGRASAQSTPDAGHPNEVSEVLVTAQRRTENVQKVPASVTALSGVALKERNIVNIDDISKMVPSVNFGTFGYGTQISARGVGMDLVGGEGESSVAVQLDGIPLGRPSMAELAQEDLQRVEFLLGPQGTLYGRNATAGVLNLITNGPKSNFEASVTAGVGNYDAWNLNGYVTGPLSDRVNTRLYLSHESREGYLYDTTTGQRLLGVDDTSVRLAVDAELTSNVTLQVRAFDLGSQSGAPAYKPLQPVPSLSPSDYDLSPWKIAANSHFDTNRNLAGASAKFIIKLNPADTINITSGYIHYNDDQNYDSDGTALNLFFNSRPQRDDQITQEIVYLHDGDRLHTTFGAFFMNEAVWDKKDVVNTPGYTPLNGLTQLSFVNTKNNTNGAIFGDATVKATSQLSFYGGLRGIWDQRQQNLTDSLVFGNTVVDLCTPQDAGGHENKDTEALTGRLGSQFEINDDSNIYGTYSHGYKSGGFNSASCADYYNPETLDAFEIGSKNRFFDRSVVLDISAFYYDFKNLQVEQVVNTSGVIDNVPKSEIYGLDLSGQWHATSQLSIDGNLSLLHARYINFYFFDQLNPTLGNQNLSGKPLDRSPDWSANLGLQYRQPIPDGSLIFRADIYASAKFALLIPANQNLDFQPAYATIGGSLTYVTDDERLRVKAWIKNASDQAVLQGMFALPLFGLGREGIYGAPRTFGVELTRVFN
jgi:iron complex outermembrane receptor protein